MAQQVQSSLSSQQRHHLVTARFHCHVIRRPPSSVPPPHARLTAETKQRGDRNHSLLNNGLLWTIHVFPGLRCDVPEQDFSTLQTSRALSCSFMQSCVLHPEEGAESSLTCFNLFLILFLIWGSLTVRSAGPRLLLSALKQEVHHGDHSSQRASERVDRHCRSMKGPPPGGRCEINRPISTLSHVIREGF